MAQRARRAGAAATVALAAFCCTTTTASAHNGIGAAFKGKAGNYIVYAYDPEALPDGRLDYRLVLLNARTKNPVYDAHPAVTATRTGAAPTTATVTTFGNVFFYRLPNPYPHDWDVHLQVTGPLGRGSVAYRMHGTTPVTSPAPVVVDPGASNWPVVLGGAFGALALVVVLVLLLRRRLQRGQQVRSRASHP